MEIVGMYLEMAGRWRGGGASVLHSHPVERLGPGLGLGLG